MNSTEKLITPQGMERAAWSKVATLYGHHRVQPDTLQVLNMTLDGAVQWIYAELESMVIFSCQVNCSYVPTTQADIDFQNGYNHAVRFMRQMFRKDDPYSINRKVPEEVMNIQKVDLCSIKSQHEMDILLDTLLTEAFDRGKQKQASESKNKTNPLYQPDMQPTSPRDLRDVEKGLL